MKTKNHRQLRIAEGGRNNFLQGKAYQLVFQYQIVSFENRDTNNVIQTERVIFRNVYHNNL